LRRADLRSVGHQRVVTVKIGTEFGASIQP
jgi:hypothetical protein